MSPALVLSSVSTDFCFSTWQLSQVSVCFWVCNVLIFLHHSVLSISWISRNQTNIKYALGSSSCLETRFFFKYALFIQLLNKLGSAGLPCSKVNLLTSGCGEGKYRVICRVPSKEKELLMCSRPKFPNGFQRRVFKSNIWGEGCSWWTFFWLVGVT